MHRGARRAPIFTEGSHCTLLLETLEDTVRQHGIEVHAYALMPNHYHLLVRSVHGNLSRAMRHLNGTYTQRLNRVCSWDGPLFRGRFRSQLVEDEAYLITLVAYIHLNPLRAHLATRPDADCWTSHRALVGLETPPPFLTTAAIRSLAGGGKKLHDLVGHFWNGRAQWPPDLELDTGWRLRGDRERAEEPQRQASAGDASTEELLATVADITGATVAELRSTVRGARANPCRRFAAWALAQCPRLRYRDVAEALDMSPRQVANICHRAAKVGLSAEAIEWKDAWRARMASR
ncbi:MAG: hypothetical protein AMXMBFR64_58220 [Myxococcales bacterium]